MKRILSLSLTATVIAIHPGLAAGADNGALCADALSAKTSFRISHQNSPTSPIHPQLQAIASAVDASTSGKLRLEIFPSAQLGAPMQVLEQAALGQNVIFYTNSADLATVGVPDFSILSGPFLTRTLADAQKLEASEVVGEMKERLASTAGVRLLALNWFDSPRSFLGKKAYARPEDLAGVKLRVPEAPVYLRTFGLLKTATTPLPFSELYLALQQGVVSATEGGIRGMADAKLMEVADTVTVSDHFRFFYGFAMSDKLYAKLPVPCQSLLNTEFTKKGDLYSSGMEEITKQTIVQLTASGTKFVQADQEAYRASTEGFYKLFPEWSKNLVQRVRDAMR